MPVLVQEAAKGSLKNMHRTKLTVLMIKMSPGHIYKTHYGHSCKVIMFDEKEVFYAAFDDEEQTEYRNRKTITYTRSARDFYAAVLGPMILASRDVTYLPECRQELFLIGRRYLDFRAVLQGYISSDTFMIGFDKMHVDHMGLVDPLKRIR